MLLCGVGFFVAGLTKPSAPFVGVGVSAILLSLIFLRQDYHHFIEDAKQEERRQKVVEARDNLINNIDIGRSD